MTPQRKHDEIYPQRASARRAVRMALQKGTLVRPSACEKCGVVPLPCADGRSAIHGHHHRGYETPLDVLWLCTACHGKEDRRPQGEKNGRRKLTQAAVVDIRNRHNPKAHWKAPEGSYRGLAREYGVSPRTIKRVVTEENWIDAALSEGGE